MKLFINKNFTSVDFVFTGYYSLRFLMGRNEYKWISKVSPKASRIENQERLNFLQSLVLEEGVPVAFQNTWHKFVERQTNYFNNLHPSSYIAGRTLRGWVTKKLADRFFVLCPEKLTFSIWRKYDSKESVHGRLVDEFVDELGTTLVVVPDNQILLFSDYINPSEGHTKCPFTRGHLVAMDTNNCAWFLAEVAPAVVEEFLD